ncbi:MAG: NAD(P)-binding domain-containing protein [Bacteroidales bacterium]|nr:NAD(P)-binding domain-containing protein [Bacteroidales bacterium]
MLKITLTGAGGKMGLRLTRNLMKSRYNISYLEVNSVGIHKLQEMGVTVCRQEECVPAADIVILAVPDTSLERLSEEIIPMMKAGSMIIMLDPAAALAGKLYPRDDISYFIAHPAHPSVFNWEPDREAMNDHFGGVAAKQSIVCTLIRGNEKDYKRGEELARVFYAPVERSHRLSLEQMGLLKPALVTTLASACMFIIRQGLDEVIDKGVPANAARDFLLGHLRMQMAVLFDELPGAVFSDATNKALRIGLDEIISEDWREIFDSESIREQIKIITSPAPIY